MKAVSPETVAKREAILAAAVELARAEGLERCTISRLRVILNLTPHEISRSFADVSRLHHAVGRKLLGLNDS
jgi:hypothetical protein